MQIYPKPSKSIPTDKQVFKKNMDTIENIDLENNVTCIELNVPGSIPIDVDYSKVVKYLVTP